jgi:hypothetical protein
MPPVISNQPGAMPIFDPEPARLSILLLHKKVLPAELGAAQVSDFVAGFLIVANHKRLLPVGLELKEFKNTFKYNGQVYKNRRSAGRPFLGPDNLPMTLYGFVFSGDTQLPAGIYNLDNVASAPNFGIWLTSVFYNQAATWEAPILIDDDEEENAEVQDHSGSPHQPILIPGDVSAEEISDSNASDGS